MFEDTTLTISSLNAEADYFFTIGTFNENGIVKGNIVKNSLGMNDKIQPLIV